MKKIFFALSLLLATISSQAHAQYVAIACVESEEALKTYARPYIFTAMFDTDGRAEKLNLTDGQLLLGNQKYLINSIDTSSETTRTRYNGDIFTRSWPVTILQARGMNGSMVTARFFAEHGSKNAMMGRVLVKQGSGMEIEFKFCTSDLFY